MRDQPAPSVDHIGVAALADLDLRDNVPNQLRLTPATLTPVCAARRRWLSVMYGLTCGRK
jgi:hypothetical protein